MNTDRAKAEQNFITCATNMRKFVHEYALILLGESDEIGHMAMKHPVYSKLSDFLDLGFIFYHMPRYHFNISASVHNFPFYIACTALIETQSSNLNVILVKPSCAGTPWW